MFKLHIIIIVVCLLPGINVRAQEPLYLDLPTCYKKAEQQFRLADQQTWVDHLLQESVGKVQAAWQPQVALNAQATYQSDVAGIPIESPLFDLPTVPKDQYRANIDVSQLIYDGGLIHQQKSIQELQAAVEMARTESNFFPIYQQIDQLFCNVLLARDQQLLIQNLIKDLENKTAQLQTALQFGTATNLAVRTLEAESLKASQRMEEAKFAEQGALSMLSALTGISLDENIVLLLPPALTVTQSDSLQRPELQVFNQQLAVLEAQADFASAINMPKVSAFVQGGYGNPGLNFLLDEFDTYYMVGIRLNYPLWSGGTHAHEAEMYRINQQVIEQQKHNFITGTHVQAAQYLNEIAKLESVLHIDNELIEAQEAVLQIAALSLENGTSTAADYSRDANAALQAKLNKQLHSTQLRYAQLQYQKTLGIK
jgi:outer membrane protein TolC